MTNGYRHKKDCLCNFCLSVKTSGKVWNKGMTKKELSSHYKRGWKNKPFPSGKEHPNFKKKINVKCKNCEKEMKLTPYFAKHKKFCSKLCYDEFRRTPKGKKLYTNGKITRFSSNHRPNWKKAVKKLKSSNNRKKMREYRKKQQLPTHHTNPEIKFMKLCEEYNLPFIYTGDSSFWIGNKNPDFIHKKKKIVVEIFGVYWHSRKIQKTREEAEFEIKKYYKGHGWDCFVIWSDRLDFNGATNIMNSSLDYMSEEGVFLTIPETHSKVGISLL